MPTKSFSSVDAVTLALCRLLQAKLPNGTRLTMLPPSEVAKTHGAGGGTPGRVNVFLYRISTNPVVRNPLKPVHVPGEQAIRPNILADLHYLVTAHATAVPASENSAHHLLEVALAAITERPILQPADLATETNPTPTAAAEILVEELTLEELTRLWSALGTALQLSVALVVRNAVL